MQESHQNSLPARVLDFFDQLLKASNYLVLLNGGAILACLTALKDLKDLKDANGAPALSSIGFDMGLLTFGVLFAVLGYMGLLLSRMVALPLNGRQAPPWVGNISLVSAVVFNAASALGFVWAILRLAERLSVVAIK